MGVGEISEARYAIGIMSLDNVVEEIDKEIARLQEARKILTGSAGLSVAISSKVATAKAPVTRNLSPAARKRIADAQKRRWAKHHAAKAKTA